MPIVSRLTAIRDDAVRPTETMARQDTEARASHASMRSPPLFADRVLRSTNPTAMRHEALDPAPDGAGTPRGDHPS